MRFQYLMTCFVFQLFISSHSIVASQTRTLAFVFDITFSMLIDLEHLKIATEHLLNTVSPQLDTFFSEYLFLPFHDPAIGQPIITENKTEFLSSIREHFGLPLPQNLDCEELALPALFTTLHFIKPYSHILIFTDDNSKHPELIFPIMNLIATKRPKISFIITPGCNFGNNDAEYEKIINATGGQMYEIVKKNVSDLVYALHEHWKSDWFEIKSEDFLNGGSHEIPIILNDLNKILISFTGKNVDIKILDPHKNIVSGNNLIDMQNVKEITIEKPVNGRWILEISSLTHHRLRVTGIERDTTSSHYFGFFAVYCVVLGLILGFCLWNYKFFVESFLKCWGQRPALPTWCRFR